LAGDEHEIKLTNSNLENTSDPRPGFSLLLNKKHHHHYLTDAHIIGQTMQKFDPVDMLFSDSKVSRRGRHYKVEWKNRDCLVPSTTPVLIGYYKGLVIANII